MKRPGPNFQDMMGECGRVGLVLQRSSSLPPQMHSQEITLSSIPTTSRSGENGGSVSLLFGDWISRFRVSTQKACCVWFREAIPEVHSHPALPVFFEIVSVCLVSPFAWAGWFRVLCESSCARVGSTRVVLFWPIVFLLGGGTILVVLFWLF